jgi:hypothetical protein
LASRTKRYLKVDYDDERLYALLRLACAVKGVTQKTFVNFAIWYASRLDPKEFDSLLVAYKRYLKQGQ